MDKKTNDADELLRNCMSGAVLPDSGDNIKDNILLSSSDIKPAGKNNTTAVCNYHEFLKQKPDMLVREQVYINKNTKNILINILRCMCDDQMSIQELVEVILQRHITDYKNEMEKISNDRGYPVNFKKLKF